MMNSTGLYSIVEEWKLRGKPEQLATDWDPGPWIDQFPVINKTNIKI